MNILYVTSEAVPFCKTGGLADVAGSLPPSLAATGESVSVILPLYETVKDKWGEKLHFERWTNVRLAWREVYCGLFSFEYEGVTWYFIDNESYFRRRELYGHYDDGERFAFFSRAVTELLPSLPEKPDVVHCNDWQSALVPVYIRDEAVRNDFYKSIRTVITVHNIEYQGRYGRETVEDLFGLDSGWFDGGTLAFDGDVNLLKGAIVTADAVTAVSPTYAQELKCAYFAHGLETVMRMNEGKLYGVLNGIDMKRYDPAHDKALAATYSAGNLAGKKKDKAALQKLLGLQEKSDTPIIAMVTRLVSHKGLDLVKGGVDNIMTYSNAQFVVLGSGDWEYEQFFKEMQAKYPGRFVLCQGFVPELARKIYGGSDIFLMPSKSEPCGLSQMVALRYGSIPVVRETGGLKDSITDSGDGKGNGFTFQTYDTQDMLNSVHRAIYAYNESKDGWKVLVERAMACDNSWGRSANDYIRLYKQLINS